MSAATSGPRIYVASLSDYNAGRLHGEWIDADQGAEGMGVFFSGAELALGTGVIADQLRSLGLPKRPLMCAWMERMYATFGPAEKL